MKKPITPEMSLEWVSLAQPLCLEAIMQSSKWSVEDFAFHGGTSLYLSWGSQRYSEDLDFLLSEEVDDIDAVMEKARKQIEEVLTSKDPSFIVELKNKTKDIDRMPVYHLAISQKDVLGKAMVKVEFWRVAPEYLRKYPTALKTPRTRDSDLVGRVTSPVNVASLDAAFADKLTAFATRPHLKWRDIYDLWWIGTQRDGDLKLSKSELAAQFLQNLSAYNTVDGLSPADALRHFLRHDTDELIKKADPDLKRWVPESFWERANPKIVAQMVEFTKDTLAKIADEVDVLQAAQVASFTPATKTHEAPPIPTTNIKPTL